MRCNQIMRCSCDRCGGLYLLCIMADSSCIWREFASLRLTPRNNFRHRIDQGILVQVLTCILPCNLPQYPIIDFCYMGTSSAFRDSGPSVVRILHPDANASNFA